MVGSQKPYLKVLLTYPDFCLNQLYCDLRKLEESCTRERWLTIPEDVDIWEQYAKENGFIEKSSDGKIFLF